MDLARKMTEGSPNEVVGEMVNKINQINESSDKLVDVMRGLSGKPTTRTTNRSITGKI